MIDEVDFEESDLADVRETPFAGGNFFDHGFANQFGDDENDWDLSSDESELTELSSDEDETPTAPAPVPAPPKPPPRRSTRAQNTKEYRVRATTGFFPTKHPLKSLSVD